MRPIPCALIASVIFHVNAFGGIAIISDTRMLSIDVRADQQSFSQTISAPYLAAFNQTIMRDLQSTTSDAQSGARASQNSSITVTGNGLSIAAVGEISEGGNASIASNVSQDASSLAAVAFRLDQAARFELNITLNPGEFVGGGVQLDNGTQKFFDSSVPPSYRTINPSVPISFPFSTGSQDEIPPGLTGILPPGTYSFVASAFANDDQGGDAGGYSATLTVTASVPVPPGIFTGAIGLIMCVIIGRRARLAWLLPGYGRHA